MSDDSPRAESTTANDGLPPSLCRHCLWGSCQTRVRRLDPDELEILEQGSPVRSVAFEVSYCDNRSLTGESSEASPIVIEEPVTECEGFQDEAWAVKAELEIARRKAAAKLKKGTSPKGRAPRGRKRQ